MTHLRAVEFEVLSVGQGEAVEFLARVHYAKGAPNTSVYRHGLYRSDPLMGPLRGELLGVALWLPPTRRAAESVAGEQWRSVFVLSRLAVDPTVPTNGASFLLGRSMRAVDRRRWPVLLTYADTALGHTGAIYRATNWTCVGEVAAGDTWVDADGRQWGRKRGGRSLTRAEMEERGLTRRGPAPKIKFVHDARRTGRATPALIAR